LAGKSKTIQANATVSAMVNSAGLVKVTTTAAHGFETGDIVQLSGTVGTVEANGQWVVNSLDATHLVLNNSFFANTYVSGGTVQHIGWATALSNFNFTFFLGTPLSLIGKVQLQSAPAGSTIRFVFDDAAYGDTGFLTSMPGPTFHFAGGQTAKSDAVASFVFMPDWPDLRLNYENTWRLRVLWGKGTPGQSFTFSSWMEY